MNDEHPPTLRPSRPGVPLPYEAAPPGVSRRAFRALLGLTLLDTVLLGSVVVGPQRDAFARRQWAEYQQRRAEREKAAAATAERVAVLPAQEAALGYAAPADLVVYADGGTEAEQVAARAAAATRPSGVTWPGTVPLPEPLTRLPGTVPGFGLLVDAGKQVLFLHERRVPGSDEPLLVVVRVEPKSRARSPRSPGSFRNSEYDHDFTALALQPATGDRDLAVVRWSRAGWNPAAGLSPGGTVAAMNAAADAKLALYAGQPDPDDPGRFTIRYTLGGAGGEIVGRVEADRSVTLRPTGPMASGWRER